MQRYGAYRDSGVEWIGEIPEGWEVAPIKHLATCNDETLPEGTNGEYRFRYVDISAVSENSIGEYQEMRFRDAPSRARRVVRAGDVLVSTVRTYLKAIARVDDPENVIASTGFAVLRPRRIASRFFAYSLLNDCFAQVVSAYSVGISYPAINSSELVKLNLAVPGIAEQQAIADYLDGKTAEIDSIVSQTERSIELLREYRKSVISEAVTKGLDPDAPMRDSGVEWIGEIPEGWCCSRLKFYIEGVRVGPFGSAVKTSDYVDNGVPMYTQETVIKGDHSVSKFVTTDKAGELASFSASPGDFLVTTRGSLGYLFELPSSAIDGVIHPCLIRFRLKEASLNKPFLKYVANGSSVFDGQISFKSASSTIPVLYSDDLRSLYLVIPPLPEQQAIADYLDAKTAEIDSLIADKQRQVELLREYRKSLISEAVTGKFKVPGLE